MFKRIGMNGKNTKTSPQICVTRLQVIVKCGYAIELHDENKMAYQKLLLDILNG